MPDSSNLTWLFFKISGRVSRAAYFLGGLLVAIIQAFPLYRFTLVPEGSAESNMWSFIFFIAFIASLWSNIALAVKRLHDLDKPGIAALILFVPVVSIVAFLVLCLFPGQPGPNRYGRRTNEPAQP
ncbi:hypothetical protein BFX40_05650 [Mesorhizobium sp. SEMIA 3007]|uniref:DUF805 domain-containing protein n=1 Tax=Mesorhizobium TaxID=68287 RepID=UPI000372A7C3|nr:MULTISPECIES: DUF805 domain-containing protein [Mesorhizobium]ANN55844.1 hypothetical protein A9174_03055 [Mesorhizobium loti NZP2037]MCH4556040.1 DUF805 domain-containing protein [Mesorhizobium jarvisii]ODA92434.1 hypothetical protein BFX40_05650 [Mesorhizobium sp. SEMIA 3007]BCH06356.1 DUF805 domain-containing protein [Mesorhizobium sp. 131-3-5]